MNEVTVEVFFTETCPNCPAQKELAGRFREEANVRLTNVNKKQGRAENHGVRSVPTTVIDGPELDQKMGFTGVMKEEKLETAIQVARGEASREELGSGSITSRLKSTIFG